MAGDGMTHITDITEPGEIERSSFDIIDSEVPEPRPFKGAQWEIVRRMIHTTADFELLSLVVFHPDAVSKGVEAIRRGCTIVTDTDMARMGIGMRRIDQWGCRVECLMGHPAVARRALEKGVTRAMVAVDMAASRSDIGIFVIGNAPTALLRLLEYVDSGICSPDLVVGMPVGFVNARESKELLMGQSKVPYISIKERKGGSAVAASVINAIAELAGRGR